MVLRRTSIFLLVLTFFGLTHNYRTNLFIQIHEIVFHGNGGYDWETIYNMPIWLRTLTYKKISDYYDSKNKPKDTVKESIQAMKSVGATTSSKVNVPSYVTKASKK
jgi:hypothetical protein